MGEKQGGRGRKKKEEGKKGGGAADCVFISYFNLFFCVSFLVFFKLSFYPFSSSLVQIRFCSVLWGTKAFPSLVALRPWGGWWKGAPSHLVYYQKIVRLRTKEAVLLMQSKMIWIYFCPLIFCWFFPLSLYFIYYTWQDTSVWNRHNR